MLEDPIITKVGEGAGEEIQEELTDSAQHAIDQLCKFIKRNKSLLHLDLSHTGLSEKQLWHFGAALRRSKSLRALHLTGNAITDRLIDYLVERAHAHKVEHQNFIDFRRLPSTLKFRGERTEPTGTQTKSSHAESSQRGCSTLSVPGDEEAAKRDATTKRSSTRIRDLAEAELTGGGTGVRGTSTEFNRRMNEAAQLAQI